MSKSSAQIDAKREEFRKYLEKEGVLESLTKTLVRTFLTLISINLNCKCYIMMALLCSQVALYEEPEKPQDPLGFVKNNFANKVRAMFGFLLLLLAIFLFFVGIGFP